MKLSVIGGGGVRAPEFTRGALAYADALDLHELWLMDTDPSRLAAITPLCAALAEGSRVRVVATTSLDDALRGSDAVVTTIRAGSEHGRVLDERIALRHGVLGQETTGAGGFAMAMRSIPAILEVAERASVLCPRAFLFNFTNPAGLVAQALSDAGFGQVIGICDSANAAQHAVARWLGCSAQEVHSEVYGLNHLSWARSAVVDGRDRLSDALADDDFLAMTTQRFFDPEWVRRKGTFLNEYLFYWYYRDVALDRMRHEAATRGEQIEALNRELYDALPLLNGAERIAAYDAYNRQRSGTYMAYAERTPRHSNATNGGSGVEPAVDGYAGVALETLSAMRGGQPLRIALNVPNGASIASLRADDVVEVSCTVTAETITPDAIGQVAEDDAVLMLAVKRYERLASDSIRMRDRALAIDALMAHPLIGCYPVAKALVADYLEAHAPWVGHWP